MGRFEFNEEKKFSVKEKVFSMSGDDFSIKDISTGDKIFEAHAKHITVHESKVLTDADGNAIYKISEATFSLPSRMFINDCETDEIAFTLRKKGLKSLFGGGKKIGVWRGDGDDGEPYLIIKGDFLKLNFSIMDVESNSNVGEVSKDLFNLTSLLTDKSQYAVQVQPGYDAVLFVLLGIVVDELFHDNSNGSVDADSDSDSNSDGDGDGDGDSSSSSSSSSSSEEETENSDE